VRTVAKIAKEEGYFVSPHPHLSEEKRAEISTDLQQDTNFSRIGRKHGVSDSTVGRIAKEEGLVSEHGNSRGQVQARRFKMAITR
jgi:transposase-like protein